MTAADKSPRMPHLMLMLLYLFGTVMGGYLMWTDLTIGDGLMNRNGALIGRDFINVWGGAKLTWAGELDILYQLQPYAYKLRDLTGLPIEFHNFSYPPHTLLLLWPFGVFDYLPSLILWQVFTGALFCWAARPYLAHTPFPAVAVLLLTGSLVNIWAGHYGFVWSALLLAAFLRFKTQPVIAGVLIGIMTIKPHLGVLLPLVLILRGDWKVFASAAATTLGLIALSALIFGPSAWVEWLSVTLGYQSRLIAEVDPVNYLYPRMMPTPWMTFRLIGGATTAIAAHILFALAALCLFALAIRRNMDVRDQALITATATFLVVPYAFNYDMPAVSLAAALMIFRWWGSFGLAAKIPLIIAYVAPVMVFDFSSWGVPMIPFSLLLFLYLMCRYPQYGDAAISDAIDARLSGHRAAQAGAGAARSA